VDIPLNDSVTSFKVVAVATGGRTLWNRDHIDSVDSELNDPFRVAPFGEGRRSVQGRIYTSEYDGRQHGGGVFSEGREPSKSTQTIVVSLASGEAKEVGWDVVAPIGVNKLQWELEASERGSSEKDRIKITQRVTPAVLVSVFQGTIVQLDKDLRFRGSAQDAISGRGGVRLSFAQARPGIEWGHRLYGRISLPLHGAEDLRGRRLAG